MRNFTKEEKKELRKDRDDIIYAIKRAVQLCTANNIVDADNVKEEDDVIQYLYDVLGVANQMVSKLMKTYDYDFRCNEEN